MELKHLKRATHILETIQELDREILELDRFAVALVNQEITATFNLCGTKVEEEKPATCKMLIIDKDGDAMELGSVATPGLSGLFGFSGTFSSNPKPKEPELQISEALDEKLVLQLLAVILNHRNSQRELQLRKLHRMGVTI